MQHVHALNGTRGHCPPLLATPCGQQSLPEEPSRTFTSDAQALHACMAACMEVLLNMCGVHSAHPCPRGRSIHAGGVSAAAAAIGTCMSSTLAPCPTATVAAWAVCVHQEPQESQHNCHHRTHVHACGVEVHMACAWAKVCVREGLCVQGTSACRHSQA